MSQAQLNCRIERRWFAAALEAFCKAAAVSTLILPGPINRRIMSALSSLYVNAAIKITPEARGE